MLKIEHLTKTYGGKPAVQDLCLHIRPGELCAFIGHNGAGKTTTLKCCCGIQQFDTGEIYVDGISVRENPLGNVSGSLAYLPDDPQLYEYMTGIQYLDFIADIFGVSAAQRVQRIRQYGDAFGLTQDLAQSIGAYFPRHEAEACHHCGAAARAEAYFNGRAFCRAGPTGLPSAQDPDESFLCAGRRDLLLHPCAGSGGKTLRPGSHSPQRTAGARGCHGAGARR